MAYSLCHSSALLLSSTYQYLLLYHVFLYLFIDWILLCNNFHEGRDFITYSLFHYSLLSLVSFNKYLVSRQMELVGRLLMYGWTEG
jgi:hypothetical protein